MKAIVNVNQNWAIGAGGDLLVQIPGDMRFFRESTRGKVVLMGRKTLESFPGKRPLKGRINIVLTGDPERIPKESLAAADRVLSADAFAKDASRALSCAEDGQTVLIIAQSPDALLQTAHCFPAEDLYVIGGEAVYRALLPCCDTCLVTVNDFSPAADRPPDAWFPNLDLAAEWKKTAEGPLLEENGIHYRFCTYERS